MTCLGSKHAKSIANMINFLDCMGENARVVCGNSVRTSGKLQILEHDRQASRILKASCLCRNAANCSEAPAEEGRQEEEDRQCKEHCDRGDDGSVAELADP